MPNHLFQQGRGVLLGLAAFALLFPIADLDNALHTPTVPNDRIPLAMMLSLLAAVIIIFPTLLFISSVTRRMFSIIGLGKTVALSLLVFALMVSITGSQGDDARWLTPTTVIDVITYAIVLSAIHFFVKGKQPFFA